MKRYHAPVSTCSQKVGLVPSASAGAAVADQVAQCLNC
jgi:hypothetical protein